MPVHTENNPDCPHCALSKAILDWRHSDGAKAFVVINRKSEPEATRLLADDQILAFGIMRAMGAILADIQSEQDSEGLREELVAQFQDSCIETATEYYREWARKGQH